MYRLRARIAKIKAGHAFDEVMATRVFLCGHTAEMNDMIETWSGVEIEELLRKARQSDPSFNAWSFRTDVHEAEIEFGIDEHRALEGLL